MSKPNNKPTTPLALAREWWRLFQAGNDPAISDDEAAPLFTQAGEIAACMAAIPSGDMADLTAKIRVMWRDRQFGEFLDRRDGMLASIVADAERLAGPELAGILDDPRERRRAAG